MRLLEEDRDSGLLIYSCPECGWKEKQYGKAAAAPEPERIEAPATTKVDNTRRSANGAVPVAPKAKHYWIITAGIVATALVGLAIIGDNFMNERTGRTLRGTCESGDATACYNLGVQYEFGDEVKLDETRAASLYQQACDGGDMRGCIRLGGLYANGTGVTQDYTHAAALYERGCLGGHAEGCANIGFMYYSGEGVAQDYVTAASLYQKGCDGGNAFACGELAGMYIRGTGLTQDSARAAALYEKACSNELYSSEACR
jgi:TPR repeat protein